MSEYDELDTYNGDQVHDGWVDFDYNENTGELSDLFLRKPTSTNI